MSDSRKQYTGSQRSLVVAIDVGTTFSGVSYAILEPGEIPKIHGVTRFPGQEHVAGNSKIPSVIYYDPSGKVIAAGAEADTSAMESQAEDEGWIKTELFKLRLRPRIMKLEMNGMRLGSLPRGKSAVDVFGDFLGYLYQCTRNFIIDTHANGRALWKVLEPEIQFVLSHPNGWEGAQQTKMRRAAEYGGLIPSTNEGRARIRFVTEGEASLHACVLNGLAADVLSMSSKPGFLIADAGGGTLDISSYQIKQTSPLVMEEIAPPDCIFAGSVFVDRRAREFLGEKLKNSKYGTADALDHIAKRFSETTKRLFRDRKDMQFIPFGSPLDKDISVGIRGGQLKLTGDEVSELFEPSIEAAVIAIRAQIAASNGLIKSVWLVGGFAASPWLFSQLQERLGPLNVTVSRPDSQTSKAVADGAVGFWCDHHVHARMSKFCYGVEYLREFDSSNAEHLSRKERLCELPSGPKLLPDAFDCILARGVKVKESTVFTRKYSTELTSLSMLSVFEVEVWCYRGQDGVPPWILRDRDDFSTLCVVRANLANLAPSAQPKEGKNGKVYWTIIFSVEIHFGLTEFKARIKWVDSNGKIKYGPASIVYNESGHRAEEDEDDDSTEDDLVSSERQGRSTVSRPVSRANSRDSYRSYSLNEPPPVPDLPKMDNTPPPASVYDVHSMDTASTHSSRARSPSRSSRHDSDSERAERRRSRDIGSLKLSESHLRGDGSGSLSTPQFDAQLASVWDPPASSTAETPSSSAAQSVYQSPVSRSSTISTAKTPVAARSPAISRSSTISKPPTTASSMSRVPSSTASKIGTPLKQSAPIPPSPSPKASLAQVAEEPARTPTTVRSALPSKIGTPVQLAASIPPSPKPSMDQLTEEAARTPMQHSRAPSVAGSVAGSKIGTPLRNSMVIPPIADEVPKTPAQLSRAPSAAGSIAGSKIGTPLKSSVPVPEEGSQTPLAPSSRIPSVAGSRAPSVAGSRAPSVAGSVAGTPAKPSAQLPALDPMPSLAEESPATPAEPPAPPPPAQEPEADAGWDVPVSSKKKKKTTGKAGTKPALAALKTNTTEPPKPAELPPPETPAVEAPPAPPTPAVEAPAAPLVDNAGTQDAPPAAPEAQSPLPPSKSPAPSEKKDPPAPPSITVDNTSKSPIPSTPAMKPGTASNRNSQFLEPIPEPGSEPSGGGLFGGALGSLSNRASGFGFGTPSARQSLFGGGGSWGGGWGGGSDKGSDTGVSKRLSGIGSALGWGDSKADVIRAEDAGDDWVGLNATNEAPKPDSPKPAETPVIPPRSPGAPTPIELTNVVTPPTPPTAPEAPAVTETNNPTEAVAPAEAAAPIAEEAAPEASAQDNLVPPTPIEEPLTPATPATPNPGEAEEDKKKTKPAKKKKGKK